MIQNSVVIFNLSSLTANFDPAMPWNAANIAEINHGILKVIKIGGEVDFQTFDKDQFFLVFKGQLIIRAIIDGEKQEYTLESGYGIIIPANIEYSRSSSVNTLALYFDIEQPTQPHHHDDHDHVHSHHH